MRDEEQINPGHGSTRQILRIVGPAIGAVGVVFIAVGMISFFSAMQGFEQPRYFWCCFVGAPLLAVGSWITQIAFMGSFFRYVAGEAAPVQKDTLNYLARGVRGSVKDLTQATAEGWRAGLAEPPAGETGFCDKCGRPAAADAQYCSGCGQKLT